MFGMFPKGWSTLRRLAFLYSSTLCERIVELSGAVISFIGRSSTEILSLTASITPVQDLHGYDSPWPGGGGKNKLPNTAQSATVNNVQYVVNAVDGSITANGTSNGWTGLAIGQCTLPAGTWYLESGVTTGYEDYYLEAQIGGVNYSTNVAGGRRQFVLSAETSVSVKLYVRSGATVTNAICYPMIRADGESTEYAPYANICPITGWTGANVYVSPTTAQADATTYAVNWTSEAGTVYGGTLDVVSGVLTATMEKSSVLASGLSNNGSAGDRYKVFYRVAGRAYTKNVICNYFNKDSGNPNYYVARTNGDGIEFTLQNSLIGVQTSDDDNTVKLPAAKAWFTQNNVELCYELATPIEYTLTPQEVQTLVGQNYLWSDVGDVTATIKNAR